MLIRRTSGDNRGGKKTMTHVGSYISLKGTAFEVTKGNGRGFTASFGGRRFGFDEVESTETFSAAVRATGASHVIRSGVDQVMIGLDTATAERLSADMATAAKAAHDAEVAAALAEPGSRYAVEFCGSACNLGIARDSGGKMAPGFFYFLTLAELPHIRLADFVVKFFGHTNQGSGLIEVKEEEIERLNTLNAARADEIAQAQATEAERSATIAAIPVEVVKERAALRREYNIGQNEGGDGYDPYASWWSPRSMDLLRRRAPVLAMKLESLGEG